MSAKYVIVTVQKYKLLWNVKHLQYHNKLVAV